MSSVIDRQKAEAILRQMEQVGHWLPPADPARPMFITDVSRLMAVNVEHVTEGDVRDLARRVANLRGGPLKTLLHRRVTQLRTVQGLLKAAPPGTSAL